MKNGYNIIFELFVIGCLAWSSFTIYSLKNKLEKTQSALTECVQKGENFNEK